MSYTYIDSDTNPANPLRAFGFAIAGATNVGLQRRTNQDVFTAELPVILVADGMGGHADGHLAATAIAQAFQGAFGTELPTQHSIQHTIDLAHHQVAALPSQGRTPGSTVTGVAVGEESNALHWQIFNVGDSRTYKYNHGDFTQITVDHSEVQELIADGQLTLEAAQTYKYKNVITRALGGGYVQPPVADFWMFKITDGDRLLLCSDGLTGMVSDEQIKAVLDQHSDPAIAVDKLIALALAHGGRDNVTVVLVQAYANPAFAPVVPAEEEQDWYDDVTADKLPTDL